MRKLRRFRRFFCQKPPVTPGKLLEKPLEKVKAAGSAAIGATAQYEQAIMKTLRVHSRRRFRRNAMIVCGSTAFITGGVMYFWDDLFYPRIVDEANRAASQVTQDVLSDQDVYARTLQLVGDLTVDDKCINDLSIMFQTIINDPKIQHAFLDLLYCTFQDPTLQQQIGAILQNVLIDLLEMPRFRQAAIDFLSHPDVQATSGKALKSIVGHAMFKTIYPWGDESGNVEAEKTEENQTLSETDEQRLERLKRGCVDFDS